MLTATIVVWTIESRAPHPDGRQLLDTMVDGLKVGLGALIGVLSQWAHQSFQSDRAAASETASG